MEQLNIFYYYFLTKLVYVHDEQHCQRPFFWKQQLIPMHDFTMDFIDAVYKEMLTRSTPPRPLSPRQ